MGTFKDSLKKWFYTQGTTAAATTSRIPLLDASGNPIGSDTPDNLFKKQPLFTANVGVAVYESDFLCFRQPDEALSRASSAVGVWIQECGKLIIVAKDQQESTKWATSSVSGGTTAKGREGAIADMGGRANTSTIITTLGDNAPAAKFCHEYYPSNVDAANAFVGAGRWWLPSAGELWMIWSHLFEVNRILTQIGGTAFNRTKEYWSSTEDSAPDAWKLGFGNGHFGYGDYYGYKAYGGSVRPVSAFY
jgi:hypothetical protein